MASDSRSAFVGRAPVLLIFLTLVGALAGCRSEYGAGNAAAAATTVTYFSQSPQWAAEGVRLTEAKQQGAASDPSDFSGSTNAGDNYFAYQSLPVDITGDGTYLLDFGPLDSGFNYPQSPSGYNTEWPPDSFKMFQISPIGTPTIITINGQPYLQTQVKVSNFSATYPQFTAWIF